MSNATFSGPLRAGTVREGNTPNVGGVVLSQSTVIPFGSILTAPAAVVVARLPAGAKITGFSVEKVAALVTATECNLSLGVQGGSATQFATAVATGTAIGKLAAATIDAAQQVVNTNNIGVADIAVTATPTAATANATAGSIVVTTFYVQRNADGS